MDNISLMYIKYIQLYFGSHEVFTYFPFDIILLYAQFFSIYYFILQTRIILLLYIKGFGSLSHVFPFHISLNTFGDSGNK